MCKITQIAILDGGTVEVPDIETTGNIINIVMESDTIDPKAKLEDG